MQLSRVVDSWKRALLSAGPVCLRPNKLTQISCPRAGIQFFVGIIKMDAALKDDCESRQSTAYNLGLPVHDLNLFRRWKCSESAKRSIETQTVSPIIPIRSYKTGQQPIFATSVQLTDHQDETIVFWWLTEAGLSSSQATLQAAWSWLGPGLVPPTVGVEVAFYFSGTEPQKPTTRAVVFLNRRSSRMIGRIKSSVLSIMILRRCCCWW
jgi:hypothetical protein